MYKKLSENDHMEILEAAISEFSLNGPDKANISSIARRAGVSVGVIYKYYAGKEELFLACVRHSLKLLDEVLSEAVSSDCSVEESIEKVIRALIENAKSHESYNAMYNEITSGSCRKYADMLSGEIESRSAGVYRSMLDKAKAEGRICPDCDCGINAFFFDSLLVTLQFSYSCDYYRNRMKIFCGEDIFDNEENIVQAFKSFMSSALMLK